MKLVRLVDQEPYVPAGHDGTINRLLIGRALQGDPKFSIWHGRLSPGGGAHPHNHAGADQAYVGLSGRLEVRIGDEVAELTPMTAIWVPADTVHEVWNRSDADAELLVISSPALR